MITLYLLRHAKSSWNEPDVKDHDRPLNKRGRRAATLMGEAMARRRWRPALVLCSTAVRTRETLGRVLPHLGAPRVSFARSLYLASRARIMSRLKEIDDGVRSAMLIGHEPGIGAAAVGLLGPGSDEEAAARLRAKFPTGALAVFEFPENTWSELRAHSGKLTAFITPKSLE